MHRTQRLGLRSSSSNGGCGDASTKQGFLRRRITWRLKNTDSQAPLLESKSWGPSGTPHNHPGKFGASQGCAFHEKAISLQNRCETVGLFSGANFRGSLNPPLTKGHVSRGGVTARTSQSLGKLRGARAAPPPGSRPAPPLDYKSRRTPHSRTLRQGKMADAAATAGAAGSGTVRAGGRRGAGAETVGAFGNFPSTGP